MTIFKESDREYHARDALTATKLAAFRQSPRLYYMRHIAGLWPRASSASFSLGTLAHLLLLEPEREKELRTDAPINKKTGNSYGVDTKKCEEWRADVAASGQIAVDISELATAKIMVSHAREVCAIAGIPIDVFGPNGDARAEITVLPGEKKQCRPDILSVEHGLIDVKTTSRLDNFRHSIHDYSYDLQAAWYQRLCLEELDIKLPWRWLVLESVAPYRVAVFSAPLTIQRASDAINPLMSRMEECAESNLWPLSLTGYEKNLDP